MRKIIALLTAMIMVIPTIVYANTDDYVLRDKPANIYTGRDESTSIINNLQFTDIPNSHWAKEAIIRDAALNFVKGYSENYNPDSNISNQEALAFLLRVLGLEKQAIERGTRLEKDIAVSIPLTNVWSLGYLDLAALLGYISPMEYMDALSEYEWFDFEYFDYILGSLDDSDIYSEPFYSYSPVTREKMADWIVRTLVIHESGGIPPMAGQNDEVFQWATQTAETVNNELYTYISNNTNSVQVILGFNDYDNISPEFALTVEMVASNGIMSADSAGNFYPKGYVTKSDMASILKNMNSLYFDAMGYDKKTGTVALIQDEQYTSTGEASITRNIYVRRPDGTIDLIKYRQSIDNSSVKYADSVVYRNGVVSGLGILEEGDEIEFIFDKKNNELFYVNVTQEIKESELQGFLDSINVENSSITIKDASGKEFIYSMAFSMLNVDNKTVTILMDGKKYNIDSLPYGDIVKLNLVNNIVTSLSYVGQPNLYNEVRGIVVENDPDLGYLTIIDNQGNVITKYYYENDLKVKKRQYYNLDDDIGYIDQIFPNFKYNPLETDMYSIEPGDIVFLRMSPQDPNIFTSISASTDYVVKYGKVKQITHSTDYSSILIEYENKQTAWYDIANEIYTTKDGKHTNLSDVQTGDWVKLLVNQATLAPGNSMESVKELIIEGNEHFISTIAKGSLSGIDSVQQKLVLKDAYTLEKNGWTDYKNLETYSLAGKDIEYYHDDKQVSLDYAMKYFKRSDASVYVALENNPMGNKIKKVTFRNDRDEVLEHDTLIAGNGVGTFSSFSHMDDISADNGTIVRKYGRLVDHQDINGSEYAQVVLNGEGKAAIVDIIDLPSTERISIVRGRVLSVDEGKSFTVQSMSTLNGMEWQYSPVQRVFSIDHNTVFLTSGSVDAGGDGEGGGNNIVAKNFETFLGYTDDTVVDKVFNVVVDGTKALYVIDSPYTKRGVRGTIYDIDEDTIYIKDAYYYDNDKGSWDNDKGSWNLISRVNPTISIKVPKNAIIAKNDDIVQIRDLEKGDQIRVMTDTFPDSIQSGMEVDGYIIINEK